MLKNIVVYTAIIGDLDTLRDPEYIDEGVDYICFTDNPEENSQIWKHRPAELVDGDPTRTARHYKVLSHHHFPEYRYSLWLDGTLVLRYSPVDLIGEYLKDTDIALHSHYVRQCIYDEARECIRLRMDLVKTLQRQVDTYRRKGFPENEGLYETGVLLRRHSETVSELNERWWKEIKLHSTRDQISFPYVKWKNNMAVSLFPNTVRTSPYFQFYRHPRRTHSQYKLRVAVEHLLGNSSKVVSDRFQSILPRSVRRNLHKSTLRRQYLLKEVPENHRITLAYPFCGDSRHLETQIQTWRQYSAVLRRKIDILLISYRPEDLPEIPEDININIIVYRPADNLLSNVISAKNFAVEVARTNWLLISTINHVVCEKALSQLLRIRTNYPRRFYTFSLDFPANQPKESLRELRHRTINSATLFTCRRTLLQAGGYDEEFTAISGYDNEILRWHLAQNWRCHRVHLNFIRFRYYTDESESTAAKEFSGATNSDKNLCEQKRSLGHWYRPSPRLPCSWERVLERSYRKMF